jgi:hypothetical protein
VHDVPNATPFLFDRSTLAHAADAIGLFAGRTTVL